MHSHQDIQVNYWGDKVDENYYTSLKDLQADQAKSVDVNSSFVDLNFVDVAIGKFDLISGNINFQSLNLNDVGVRNTRLKRLLDSPHIPEIHKEGNISKGAVFEWKGAKLKSIESLGEQSAH